MKKFLSLTVLLIMACFALVGCGSSVVVPEVKLRWSGSSTETLTYDVRLASDYELTYTNYYSRAKNSDGEYVYTSNLDQVAPSKVENGVYSSTITPVDGRQGYYSLKTELSFTEFYDDAAFIKAGISDLTEVKRNLTVMSESEAEKAGADGVYSPIIEKTENGIFRVNVSVSTQAVFNGTNLLPDSSSRSVRSVYVGKADCSLNSFDTDVSYDYSAKRPVVTVQSSLSEEAISFRLKKTDTVKTYDNELLFLLLRCFDKDALVSNSSTSVNLVEGSFAKEPTTVTVYTSQNLSKLEDFKVGAVWAGDYDSSKDTAEQKDKFNDKNELCRYLNEGENFTDLDGNPINVVGRNVYMLYIAPVSGLNIMTVFDNQESLNIGRKQRLLRAQQGYLVFDLNESGRSSLDI